MAVMYTANHMKVRAIVALTESGATPLWMSRIRADIAGVRLHPPRGDAPPRHALSRGLPGDLRCHRAADNATPAALYRALFTRLLELQLVKQERPGDSHQGRAVGRSGRHQLDADPEGHAGLRRSLTGAKPHAQAQATSARAAALLLLARWRCGLRAAACLAAAARRGAAPGGSCARRCASRAMRAACPRSKPPIASISPTPPASCMRRIAISRWTSRAATPPASWRSSSARWRSRRTAARASSGSARWRARC